MTEKNDQSIEKAYAALHSVRCIVKKGSETKYDDNLTNQGGSFHGDITGLEPGNDYSVLLYGKNTSSEIVARGYKSGVNVTAGKTETVTISWGTFIATLTLPVNGSTTNDNTPTFDWSDAGGAAKYDLAVMNSGGSDVIRQSALTTSSHTPSTGLPDGTYTWKVRCQDDQGNWGGWSGVWNLTITTVVLAPVISVGASLDFATVTIGNSSDQTLRITNTGNAVLSVTGITSTNAQFTIVGGTSFSVSSGAYQDVTVRFTPSSAGAQNAVLHIANNSSVNPKDVSLSGTGTTVPTPVISVGASLDFATVTIGNSSDQTIRITNTGNASLSVTGITSTNTQFTVVGSTTFTVPAGTYQDVTIRFTPGSAGPQSGILRIANNSSVNPKDVSLTGTGTAVPTPVISVGASLDFGMVTIGNSNDQTLRITNSGNASLSVTGITSTNTQFTIIGGTSFSIPAGTYQDVTIRFTPASAGLQSGTLHIANNSSLNPKDVSLSGTGKSVGIVATPTFNPLPGTYNSAKNVTISCITSGTMIHYTTNGMDPTESDPTIGNGGAIIISSTTTLKVRAYKNGWDPSSITSGTYIIDLNAVTDIDGNVYHTVTIGTQEWMVENLKVTHYRNGDAIPNVTGDVDWSKLTSGAYCNYDKDANNEAIYGNLYNWYVVKDSRNIAPEGWHVPSDAEWQILVDYLGGSSIAGGRMKETGITHWNSPNTGATNESGFSGLPGGLRNSRGFFDAIRQNAIFWSTSENPRIENPTIYAWDRQLDFNYPDIEHGFNVKINGFSIRLVRGEISDTVSTPTFNPPPGIYTTTQNVSITCSTSGATIYYTTNGLDPTETDQSISNGASITISSSTTLKARAYKTGWNPSSIISGTYTINTNTITDIDGNTYQTVAIGSQVWMAENLKVTHYRNGDAIPNVTVATEWGNRTTGAYCNYNNDANNATVYGRLYNWYAVNDSRKVAPVGWHVASDAEWQTLVDYLGGGEVAGGKLKETGTAHWRSPNTGATNESGFSALPGGICLDYGSYINIGYEAYYWSSTENNVSTAWSRSIGYMYAWGADRGDNGKTNGFSIRCIKD